MTEIDDMYRQQNKIQFKLEKSSLEQVHLHFRMSVND